MHEKVKAKAVIFDLDGTLLDTKWRFYKVFNKTLRKFGLRPIDRKLFLNLYRHDELGHLLFLSERKREEKLFEFWTIFLKDFQTHALTNDRLIPGVREVLFALSKKGVPIAVTTGRISSPSAIKKELDRFEIGKFVDVIVTKEETLPTATEVDHYIRRDADVKKAAERLGVPIQDCLFVCDYILDVRSVKTLGVKTLVVLSGSSTRPMLAAEKPNLIAKSVAQLLEYVNFE